MQRLLAAINVGSLASLISGVIAVILLRGLGQLSQLGLLLRQLRQLLLLLLLLGELLRIGGRHGIDGEGQHAAQLAGHAADGAADARIAEQAADGAAQRLGHRADQVAEPALWRQLALQLLQLLQLLLLCLLRIRRRDRVGAEWQDRAANAAGDLADLMAQVGIAEQAADAASYQSAQRRADQAAEETLRRQPLGSQLRRQLLYSIVLLIFIHGCAPFVVIYRLYAGPGHAARRLQAALLASARPQPFKKVRPSRTGKARPAGRRTVPAPLLGGISHAAHGASKRCDSKSISQTVAGASLDWTGARM